jgi:hypothetical protein
LMKKLSQLLPLERWLMRRSEDRQSAHLRSSSPQHHQHKKAFMVLGVWDGNGLDTMYDTRIGHGVTRYIHEPDMLV